MTILSKLLRAMSQGAARSIKAAIERRGQIDTELGSALTEIDENLNTGLITESERSIKAFVDANSSKGRWGRCNKDRRN